MRRKVFGPDDVVIKKRQPRNAERGKLQCDLPADRAQQVLFGFGKRALGAIGNRDDPQQALAVRQMTGIGGLFSVRLGGGREAALALAARVRRFRRATSFGGVLAIATMIPALR